MILLCFFFYPFVPTLGYIVNLWHINGANREYNVQTARLELFARVAHSITGCIEAPFQLIMTTWLIMKGILDIPWRSTVVNVSGYTDRFENQIPFFSIPMWTLCFSIVDILGCAIQINIFNVYIGQLRNFKSFKRYMNLVAGHFPFFFHAICFRVIAFSFLFVYLDTIAIIPLFLIWLLNIIIGYATVGKHKIPRHIRTPLKRMQSVARQNANLPKITNEVEQKKNNENTPVWLNSFLSIFVPSCFVHTADPAMFSDTDGLTDKQKEVRKQFFEFEKTFQLKVIKYQVQTSTTILLISLGVVFYLVNFTKFGYNNNIFSNDEFNILCCVICALGLISYLFLFGINVFEIFHLNDKPGEGGEIIIKYKEKKEEADDLGEDVPDGAVQVNVTLPGNPDEVSYVERQFKTKKHGASTKLAVSIICTLLAISPIIIGYTYSFLESNNPAYLVLKSSYNATINIHMAKTRLLNNPIPSSKVDAQGILKKCDKNTAIPDTLLKCGTQQLNQKNRILLVDMEWKECLEALDNLDDIECLPYKGIILMENWNFSSSRPVNFDSKGVTKFPIASISNKDSKRISSHLQAEEFVNLIFNDFDSLLENRNSDIYQIHCEKSECTSMKYPSEHQKYISCDGEIKFKASVKMKCTSNGLPCPELESWKAKIRKTQNNFESCFPNYNNVQKKSNFVSNLPGQCGEKVEENILFPPAQCIKAKQGEGSLPKSCEEDFWVETSQDLCWNDAAASFKYWRKACRHEVECEEWASWSSWTRKDNTCTANRKPKERFRFCRKNAECVLMEREKKYLNTTSQICDIKDRKEEYQTSGNQIKDCEF